MENRNNKQIVMGTSCPISDPCFDIRDYERKHFASINDLGLTYESSKFMPCLCGVGYLVKSKYNHEVKYAHVLTHYLCQRCSKINSTYI